MQIIKNFSLLDFNTMRLESMAQNYYQIKHVNDLSFIQNYIKSNNCDYFILGGGSNILLPEIYNGVVIHNQLNGIEVLEGNSTYVKIRAMAGVNWDQLVEYCVKNNYYGLENLSLIPGTVGAAPIQNIGAYGVEVKDFIDIVEYYDFSTGEYGEFLNRECDFSYRHSRFKVNKKFIVIAVVFKLMKKANFRLNYGDVATKLAGIKNPTGVDLRNCIIEIRKSKLPDPRQLANVGSFFHNPILTMAEIKLLQQKYPRVPVYPLDDRSAKISAGWLIDTLGFKGFKYKNVGVYDKQALVLVNYAAKNRDEVLELAKIIQNKVKDESNIWLSVEPITI